MAVDMFMKMKGEVSGDIKGEARDKVHADEIEVLSWNWGMTGAVANYSGGKGASVQIQNFTFKKPVDKSSPILVSALCRNEKIIEAKFVCRKVGISGGDPVEFTVIKFEKGTVNRITRAVAHDDDRAIEEVTISFQKFTEDYTEQTADGKKVVGPSATHELSTSTTG